MNIEKTLFGCVILGLGFAVLFVITGRDQAKWISGAFAIACFVQIGYIVAHNDQRRD